MRNTVWKTLGILAVVGPMACNAPIAPAMREWLESATTYQLRSSDDGTTTVIDYAQAIFGFGSQELTVKQDVLLLIDGCCDGFAFRFERAS